MADPTDFAAWLRARQPSSTTATSPLVPTQTPQQRFAESIRRSQEAAGVRAAAILEQNPVAFPDAVGGVQRADAATSLGAMIPPELLTDVTDELTQSVAAQTRQAQLQQMSGVSRWLTAQPLNAALAQDELQDLGALEHLFNRFARGGERLIFGTAARQRTRTAEDDLQSLQDARADKTRSFGEIVSDVQTRRDAASGRTEMGERLADTLDGAEPAPDPLRWVGNIMSYPQAAMRYVGAHAAFGSDEKMAEYEGYLRAATEDALLDEAQIGASIARRTGATANVARANVAMGEIGELATNGEKLSALGSFVMADPTAFAAWLVGVTAESLPNILVSGAVKLATRSPGLGAATMGVASSEVSEAAAFETLVREAGVDLTDPAQVADFVKSPEMRRALRDRAFRYGAVVGLIDTISGGVAGQMLAKSPFGNLVLQALAQGSLGASGEALGLLASGQELDVIDIIVEGLAELTTAPADVAAMGGGALRSQRNVQRERDFFEALAAGTEDSEMRKAAPKQYRSLLASLTKDGPVEVLYVDARHLDALFQSDSGDVTADQFVKALPGVDFEAFVAAREAGGSFEIPTATYATDIVGTDFDAMIREHLRVDPANMSVAQARETEEHLQSLTDTARKLADEIESGQRELETAAETARLDLVSELQKAGRTAVVAEKEALQSVAFAVTMSQRLGISVEDFLARYPLAKVSSALANEQAAPPLFQPSKGRGEPPEQPLTVAHNIRAEGLRLADDMGGLAAPSLAVVRADLGPPDGFGEITLIAGPQLADPRQSGIRTFNTDVYSVRQPRAEVGITTKDRRAVEATLDDAGTELGGSGYNLDVNAFESYGLSHLADDEAAILTFLREQEIGFRVPLRKKPEAPAALRKVVRGDPYEVRQDPTMVAAITQHAEALADDLIARFPRRYTKRADTYAFDEAGEVSATWFNSLVRGIDESRKPRTPDILAARKALRKRVRKTKKLEAQFLAWIEERFADYVGAPFFTLPNGRRRAYSLENLVRYMKGKVRDAEGFNYGIGNVRANVAKEFKSVSQIKNARGSIVTKAEIEEVKKETQRDFEALVEQIRPHHPSRDSFRFYDVVAAFLADTANGSGAEWQNSIFDSPLPDDVAENVRAFLRKLRVLPTEYFEVKAQRAVDLSEFSQALVPNDASPATLATLRKHGIKVTKYDAKAENGRRDALLPAADPRVLFQSGANADFFSALTLQVENAKQKKARAKEWIAVIQKLPGVKKAEIEWSGVREWLLAQEGPVAREDVAAFLRDNEVEVETVTLSGDADATTVDMGEDEVVEPDEDRLSDDGWDSFGERLAATALRDAFPEGVERKTEADLDDDVRSALRAEALALALADYHDNPEYKYFVRITYPDGEVVQELVTGTDDQGYYNNETGDHYSTLGDVENGIRENHQDEADERGGGDGATKWADYVEGGGEDYREVLLTVPGLPDEGPNAAQGVGDFVNENHYDTPNIVVHARLNWRKAADGSRVMFVEEVQSDLGTHWRDAGGTPTRAQHEQRGELEAARETARGAAIAALDELIGEAMSPALDELRGGVLVEGLKEARGFVGEYVGGGLPEVRAAMRRQGVPEADKPRLIAAVQHMVDNTGEPGRAAVAAAVDATRRFRAARDAVSKLPEHPTEPITPFEGEAYYALMVKKLLKMAAEEGADHLAWTPAYMQARRWSQQVQNVVQKISWVADLPMDEHGSARKVTLDGVHGADTFLVDEAGVIVGKESGGRIPLDGAEGKTIAELLGSRAIAKQIMEEPDGVIEGQNITVGGEGYKISYDQQIKKFVDKFAKKYGSRVTVDTTMPDFVKGTYGDAVGEAVRTQGTAEVVARLRATGKYAAQWAKLDADLAARRAEHAEAVAAAERGIEAEKAAHGEDALLAQLNELLRRRRVALARYDDVGITTDALWTRARQVFLTDDDIYSVLDDPDARTQGEAVWSVKITPEMRKAASEAQPLFQRKPAGARGSVLLPTEQGQAPVINLFEGADLSTFLHESGHYFLHVLQDLAANDELPGGLGDDWATINRWWGENTEGVAKDGGVTEAQVKAYLSRGTTGDLALDRKVNVGLQEQWARAYETYLMAGKAPSNALRSAFESFSAWLLSVYRRANGDLNVQVSDEMHAVFSRLLATDEEIAAVAQENNVDALVAQSAEALKISPEEYDKLVVLGREAKDEAKQRLLGSIMAPIRAARTKEYREERAKVEAATAEKVQQKPANRVREWLGNGRWLGDDASASLPADLRMNKALLVEEHGEGVVEALPRGKRPIYVAEGGVSADEVAGWFGYSSGSEMLQDVTSSPNAAAEIKNRTETEMRKRYGDPLGDGTIEEEAVEAIHGEKRGQLIAAELRAIGKNARVGVKTTRRQARAIARRVIRRMTVRQAVRSGQYLAAERRAAERSQQLVAKGDFDGAYEAKREQLLNYAMYAESREAADILARTEKRVAKLKKKSVRKNLAGEYLGAIDDILLGYDFRKSVTGKAAARREGLAAYVQMMTDAGRANELAIPSYVLDEALRKPYKSLTAAELEGVLDSLVNIEHTARMKQKLRDARDERELTVVVTDVVATMDANVTDAPRNRVKLAKEKRSDRFREFANLVLNADSILRKFDGFALGKVYDALKTSIDHAAAWSAVEREKAGEAFDKMYGVYTRREQNQMSVKKQYDQLGGQFSKWDLISIALNMGNDDNVKRLMDKDNGRGFTAAQLDFVKEQLDARDWAFTQSAWDYVNSFWEQIASRERRLTGVAPKKVLAVPVETPHGTFPGGYYPIKYDADMPGAVNAAGLVDIQGGVMAGSYGKAQTRSGHLEERAGGSGGRVLQLGIEVMHMHISQVIQDLAFSEPITNAARVLQDPRVRQAFERKGLLEDYRSLELWLQDTAAGQIATGGVMSKLALRAKNGFTLSKLAFNLSTVAVQLTGIVQSIVVVGPRYMALGYSDMVRRGDVSIGDIRELSPFMRERETTFNRDINDILGDVMRGPAASQAARTQQMIARVGFWLMQKIQYYGVDVPTWYGAYRKGLDETGGDEAKARHYADRMVARAQASGTFADRSAFERGTLSADTRQNGFIRLFTTLGSYMFAKGNVAYEVAGRTKRDMDGFNARSIAAALKGAADMALLFTVEAIAYNAIKGVLPGMGDDDEGDAEEWARFLARETTLSMMSTVPIVRDIGSGLSGFSPGAYGSVLDTMVSPIVQAAQGEADIALFKAVSSAFGTVTGFPSGQLNKTVNAWYRLEQGDDISPIEFIMGVNR